MPGYIVETKSGKKGQTDHADERVNGKVKVYVYPVKEDDPPVRKLLCDPKTLKLVGYWD